MKFGRRQKRDQDADPGAPGPDPVAAFSPEPAGQVAPDPPIAASRTQVAEPVAATFAEPEPEPESAFAADDEPVVEGEAFELFTDPTPSASETLHVMPPDPPQPPPPAPMPFPVAEQPVAVVSPSAAAAPMTTLGDAGAAFASGHAAEPGHGGGRPAPSWQEPVMELANERPEVVVGAAFAGGLLFAMILRRLGN